MSEWNPNANAFYSRNSSQRVFNNEGDDFVQQRPDQQNYFYHEGGRAYNSPRNYVGFTDFINQFQQTGAGVPRSQYENNMMQPNVGPSQHTNNFGPGPAFSQVPQYNNECIPPNLYLDNQLPASSSEDHPATLVNNRNNLYESNNLARSGNIYNKNFVLRSNLTPTATEFVPKRVVSNVGTSNREENSTEHNTGDVADATDNSGQKYLRTQVWNSRPNNQGSRQRDDRCKFGNESFSNSNQSDCDVRKYNYYRNDRNTQRNGRQYDGENWRSNNDYTNKSYNRVQPSTSRERSTFTSNEIIEDKEPQIAKKFDDLGKFKRRIKIEDPKDVKQMNDAKLTQRDSLSEQLNKGVLECLVCCDRIRQIDEIWSCGNCYHVFHLKCITKWANSSVTDSQWRCPACQNSNTVKALEYLCLCGRRRPPTWRRDQPAHSCGKLCSRPRPPRCTHPCILLCHPGPCPPCAAVIERKCECGATSRKVTCSSETAILCGNVCDRSLNCGKHKCSKSCHVDDCDPCPFIIDQVCGCPKAVERQVPCTKGITNEFSCKATCGRLLECGHHHCNQSCHTGKCNPCPTRPEAIKTCPCGQTKLTAQQARRSCLDPVPLCSKQCSKPLPCGVPFHSCSAMCHDGSCPPCPETTPVTCRCKHSSKDIPCVKLEQEQDNVRCQKKCNKPMLCGKHLCRTVCCGITGPHQCIRNCGRLLGCAGHRCPLTCHAGTCPPCSNISFRELRCACGESVVPPPVACGVRVECRRECIVSRPCGHPAHHSCHQPPTECPPCLVQTTKQCYGGHEERKTIPCHQEEFSCGMPCGKPLSCKKHKCLKVCHKGECSSEPCKQLCQEPRSSCGHPCSAPCHFGAKERSKQRVARGSETGEELGDGERGDEWGEEKENKNGCSGPIAACKAVVRATCQCGHRTAERPCSENTKEYQRLASGLLANRMQDVQLGLSIDLTDILGSAKSGASLKTLECNEECRVVDRNRRLAIALQIRNPDLSSKLTPRYSDFLKEWMKRDSNFCQNVHDKLTELVQLAKKSKQKTRSYSFPSANRQKRQFIHEMCEHFGCESVSYDEEPNRNVVATADKEKSWLPAKSLVEVVGRPTGGVRRVPGPILRPPSNFPSSSATSSTSLVAGSAKAQTTPGRSGGGWATLTSNYSGALTKNNSDESKPNTIKK